MAVFAAAFPNQMCCCSHLPELAAPSPSLSAVVMGRNIRVVKTKLCWSDALFYCRDFYWDLLSIRSQEEQRKVEEVLRNAIGLTKHIWVGLRRYCLITRSISPKKDVRQVTSLIIFFFFHFLKYYFKSHTFFFHQCHFILMLRKMLRFQIFLALLRCIWKLTSNKKCKK